MQYEIIRKKDNAIISVKRISDGVIFSVGDTIHIKRYYYSKEKWKKRPLYVFHNSVMVDVEIQITEIRTDFPDTNGENAWLICGKYSTSLYDEANMGHIKQLSQKFLEQEEKAVKEFAQKVEQQFIPAIERMLEAEKEHLSYLKKCQNKYGKLMAWDDIDLMLQHSNNMCSHLKERLGQYQKYAEKHLIKA